MPSYQGSWHSNQTANDEITMMLKMHSSLFSLLIITCKTAHAEGDFMKNWGKCCCCSSSLIITLNRQWINCAHGWNWVPPRSDTFNNDVLSCVWSPADKTRHPHWLLMFGLWVKALDTHASPDGKVYYHVHCCLLHWKLNLRWPAIKFESQLNIIQFWSCALCMVVFFSLRK